VTGTRAEYGILYWLLEEIQDRPSLELQLLVTGTHLSPEFGMTIDQIEEDGIQISERLEILLSADTGTAVSAAIGLGVISFASAFERLKPDILVLLGDRFESLAAAIAAMVARIPIGHIAGGIRSEGAIDEAIRHSITKMSHLHFTAMEPYRDRVIQLGEQPNQVFVTGTPSLDGIRQMRLLERSELEQALDVELDSRYLLVVYHPVTLEFQTAGWQMDQLLSALAKSGRKCIFMMPNSDTGGRVIFSKIQEYVDQDSSSKVFVNLERVVYLNLMRHAAAMVGNSSSGIVEAPSFGLPVVNVGDRQRGRNHAENVIDCGNQSEEIVQALERALDPAFKELAAGCVNPHGDGYSSRRIVDLLENAELGEGALKKSFFDIGLSSAIAAPMSPEE